MANGLRNLVLVGAVLAVGAGAIGWASWKLTLGPSVPSDHDPIPGDAASSGEIADAESKLARVRAELRSRVEPAIGKLRGEREHIREQLKGLGVADSNDLKKDFRAQGFGRELAEVVGLIRVMEQKREALDKSSFEFESFIRRLKRKALVENAGLTDQELVEVNTTLRSLDAQLADIKEARPEISPAQLDSIIDEELGVNSLQGRVERQLEIRGGRLAALKLREATLSGALAAAPQNAADVENLRARLERAIHQAESEDRWPIKVAGCVLEEPAAKAALTRASEYIARQRALPAELAPVVARLQEAIKGVGGETADLERVLEQLKADAGKSDDAAASRAQEIRAKIAAVAEKTLSAATDPLLSGPAPSIEPFVLQPK